MSKVLENYVCSEENEKKYKFSILQKVFSAVAIKLGLTEWIETDTDIKCDFCLRVTGNGIANARIRDGDIVFIRKQSDADDGDMIAVLIDDEPMLKRIYQSEDIVTLMDENYKYNPIVTSIDEIEIIGKVVAFRSESLERVANG